MTTQPDYSKIYTHAPEQHPNLILGSLQLLFWMSFLPTAFKNHLKQGMVCGLVENVAFSISLNVSRNVAKGLMFAVVFGIGGIVEGIVVLGLVSTIYYWRPFVFHPLLITWNFLLYRFEQGRTSKKTSLLRFHPAFWDEWLYIPFQGLDKHLLLVMERNPNEAKAAINYLSITRQRWAAQAVQIELDARMLEACQDVNDISEITSRLEVSLESPIDNILNNFLQISEDTKAALKQSSNYNQRLVLTDICRRIERQIKGLNRSDNKYASRFQPIAIKWHAIISNYIEKLAKETELRQEIDSPYIIGVPLTLEQQIFTGRDNIGTRIEQLLLDRRRPPLLVYGQRRMGKTSLLNNLKKLLPNSIIPMFVDLQGAPSSAKNSTGFLYNLAKGMISSAKRQSALNLPSLTRETLENDPFTNFDEWLDKVEETLEQNTALLMLDEFEVLDSAISKGRFDEEDVLGMLRHLIQHRPKFKVLIAGSHTIEEYQRWASYLINVQVVNISYLLEHEARQLIVNPIEDFTLRYEPDAVERILQLTRCHPFLVQLLCSELVALKNEQHPSIRRLATLNDVEAAIPEALSTGSLFFADIQNNQVDATGLEILRFIAAKGEKAIVNQETLALEFQNKDYRSAIVLLKQRELIEELEDGYKFQVELIRRWFEKDN